MAGLVDKLRSRFKTEFALFFSACCFLILRMHRHPSGLMKKILLTRDYITVNGILKKVYRNQVFLDMSKNSPIK